MDSGALILTAQNEPEALQLLAAQRQLYSEEKSLAVLQLGLAAGCSLLAYGIVTIFPAYTSQANALAFVVSFIDCFGIQFVLGQKKRNAAKIQELFDCKVLQVTWNAGDKPLPELVIAAANRHPEDKKAKLVDWYLGRLGEVPFPVSRIVCQMTNVTYDNAVRRQYVIFLSVFLGGLLFVSLVLAIVCSMPVNQLFAGILLPFLPAISFAALQIREHLQAISRLTELRQQVDRAWILCKEKQADDELLISTARQLQDKILQSRSESATLFDWIYWICRPKQELYGEALANYFIDEYNKVKSE